MENSKTNSANSANHLDERPRHDGRGQVAAAELIQRLPSKSETLHFLMDGTFTLGNVIPVMQSRHASEWKGGP